MLVKSNSEPITQFSDKIFIKLTMTVPRVSKIPNIAKTNIVVYAFFENS